MHIHYAVEAAYLARAMALEAREALPDADDGNSFDTEDPRLAEYVGNMNRTAAMRALRACLWAYGAMSWPDDWPSEAYRAGLVKAREWLS